MKKAIEKILSFFTRQILKKYRPEIIGLTGSVGKTSTKEAIYAVLKNRFKVRANIKNYNNELGVPLTVIDIQTGGKNIFKWLAIFAKALSLILFKDQNYPQILILEMAADHPGDIEYLTRLAPCHVGVITAIGPTHLEFFQTIENLIKEKEKIITHLNENDWAVINADDSLVSPLSKRSRAKILSYGLSAEANIKAVNLHYENGGRSLGCKISDGEALVPAVFKNAVSTSQLSSLLAAVAVAKIYGFNLIDATLALKDFKFPKGRLNLIFGIKETLIIDDTYNSSPKAVKAALEVLSRLQCTGRRIAVLGDMLELGNYSETAHQEVGEWVKEFKVNLLITVGERAKDIARVAEISGLAKECVVSFDQSEEAGKFLQNEICSGDLILVKGSQGMRMEKIVKEIMAEPMCAGELLVRQEKEWQKL